MKIKVADAVGPVLDWLVAKCEKEPVHYSKGAVRYVPGQFSDEESYTPSADWSQGGPIIERERLMIIPLVNPYHGQPWECSTLIPDVGSGHQAIGPTPLIAAMRCYVVSKLGEEVEVPEELLA